MEIFRIPVLASHEHVSSIPTRSTCENAGNKGVKRRAQLERERRRKRVSRVTTSKLSVLGDVRSIELLCPQKRFPISDQTAQSPGTLSAQQVTWLFFRRPEDLKQEERETLRQLRQASPHLEAAYHLVETLLQMVADAHR